MVYFMLELNTRAIALNFAGIALFEEYCCKRLIKKPIYCVYNPAKEVISDKKNRFNGFD